MHDNNGILFDMDGTLWDSSRQVAESWTQALEHIPNPDRSYVSRDDIMHVMGLTMTDIALRMFPLSDAALRKRIMDACMSIENEYLARHGGQLYEGLEDTLRQLTADGWPLYIASNCQSGYIEAFLDYYHFRQYFKDFDCFGNTHVSKDQTMRLIASRNHLAHFWYVGDIQADYDAAVKAGGSFIHAAYGFGTVSAAVPELLQIADLPRLMRELDR